MAIPSNMRLYDYSGALIKSDCDVSDSIRLDWYRKLYLSSIKKNPI